MKIAFVQNFLLDSSGLTSPDNFYPHLGLISLIAEIEKSHHIPALYDPMLQLHKGELVLDSSIYERVAVQLLEENPDAVGFTALGCNFLAVVKIARQIRKRRPQTVILLGGPHPTVLESEIMNRFPEFDVLVRGEAEETIIPLLDALDTGNDLSEIPGISYRDGLCVRRAVCDAGVMDVDRLPLAAFHFYPIRELGLRKMRVEAGRGCPFHCTFCSTATFFGRRYRVKSAEKLVNELEFLHRTYGIRDFSLQHDLFTVNRRKVLEFCEEVRAHNFKWTCSARIDCVDPELLREMARSGCRGIYFGVETGSASLQEAVKKRLDLNLLRPTLTCARESKIEVTTSFITGFPEETVSDLKATLDCLDDCLRISPTTTSLQLHLLTPEPGTALYEMNRNDLLYDGYISDFNFPPLAADEPVFLRENSEIFMNHHFYRTRLPREIATGATSILSSLSALGGPLLQTVMDYLEISLRDLLFTILSHCGKGRITHQRVFQELVSLIDEAEARGRVIRQLVEFAWAHLRARQPQRVSNNHTSPKRFQGRICVAPRTTIFRNTFDIPGVLDRIDHRVASWRSVSARSISHCFVVYRGRAGYESKTLDVSNDVGFLLELLITPRPRAWALKKFSRTYESATESAIEDLLKRGVLQVCGSS